MRQLTKVAALAASTAVGVEAVGDVWGYTTFSCTDEIVYRYDTVAEACADHGIKAYMDSDEGIFPQCRVCDDDDDDGGAGSGGGVVIVVPICPAGQHLSEGGQCQADHECGDDEIAGEDGSCTECGKGKVPNHNKTTCISCPHGESGQFPGRCDPACWHTATDKVAKDALLGVPAEPKEQGASVYCLKETVHIASWAMSTESNACQVAFANRYAGPSCWGGGSKTDGCNLSRAHTHPFFAYPRDKKVKCHGTTISSKAQARSYNSSGRKFSGKDKRNARDADVLGHLGLPPAEPPEGAPSPTKRDTVKALRRSGKVEEI